MTAVCNNSVSAYDQTGIMFVQNHDTRSPVWTIIIVIRVLNVVAKTSAEECFKNKRMGPEQIITGKWWLVTRFWVKNVEMKRVSGFCSRAVLTSFPPRLGQISISLLAGDTVVVWYRKYYISMEPLLETSSLEIAASGSRPARRTLTCTNRPVANMFRPVAGPLFIWRPPNRHSLLTQLWRRRQQQSSPATTGSCPLPPPPPYTHRVS